MTDLLLTVALSIYDIPSQPRFVLVEACREEECVKIKVKRVDLEKENTLSTIETVIRQELDIN